MERLPALKFALLLLAIFALTPGQVQGASPYVELGPSDGVALDQPRVPIGVFQEDPVTGEEIQIYGDGTFESAYSTFALDTGANGILFSGAANNVADPSFNTIGTFVETGVGGDVSYAISDEYIFGYAGSSGSPVQSIPKANMLLGEGSWSFGSFGGISGMPSMAGKVTSWDNTPLRDYDLINVQFPADIPQSGGHRYEIPLELREFDPGEPPAPTYAPLPFLDARFEESTNQTGDSFLLDSGAAYTLFSSAHAIALGLDTDGDGELADETEARLEFGGVGGSVSAPAFIIDQLAIPTESGVELVWTDVQVGILDLDEVPGVLGMDLFTSGWSDVLGTSGSGYIEQMHLDFRLANALTGALHVDVNPELDIRIPEPSSLLSMLLLAWLVTLRHRSVKNKR